MIFSFLQDNNMSKLKNFVVGAVALAGTAHAQVALDQTTAQTGKQIYKTIAFANGSASAQPHASYSITGNKNIDVGLSDIFGNQPTFWRTDGNGGGTFLNTSGIGALSAATVDNETVGTTSVNFNQTNSDPLQKTVQSNANTLGINYSGMMKRAYADTNNDGLVDAQITTYELPSAAAAQSAGFQPGDVAIFATPEIVNNITSVTLMTKVFSYKTLNSSYIWEDTLTGPSGWSPENIRDWVSGSLGTTEINSIHASIYPNPATDKITVKLANNAKIDEYHLLSTNGQQLLTGRDLHSQESINVSKIPAGLYLLQLKVDGKVSTHKIIKK